MRLDAIDILEIALVVARRYGPQLRADQDRNHAIFHSLAQLEKPRRRTTHQVASPLTTRLEPAGRRESIGVLTVGYAVLSGLTATSPAAGLRGASFAPTGAGGRDAPEDLCHRSWKDSHRAARAYRHGIHANTSGAAGVTSTKQHTPIAVHKALAAGVRTARGPDMATETTRDTPGDHRAFAEHFSRMPRCPLNVPARPIK